MAKSPAPKRFGRTLRRLLEHGTHAVNPRIGRVLVADGLVEVVGTDEPRGTATRGMPIVQLTVAGRGVAEAAEDGFNPYAETGEADPMALRVLAEAYRVFD